MVFFKVLATKNIHISIIDLILICGCVCFIVWRGVFKKVFKTYITNMRV